jgi:hypothetical protein
MNLRSGKASVALRIRGPKQCAAGGESIAVVGPLQLPAAKSYAAVLSYAVMRPGDNSRVHTHPGPEGWYVLAGEQCLETPAGANRARVGGTMTVRSLTTALVSPSAPSTGFALEWHVGATLGSKRDPDTGSRGSPRAQYVSLPRLSGGSSGS